MRSSSVVLAAVAAVIVAPGAAAQDSVFGIRGLGFLDRSVSAKSAALGGGFALFDPASALNPAALAGWHATSGWAVASASSRTFDTGAGTSSLSSTRFPVVGFAGLIGSHVVLAVTASDYLDRNWSVQQSDSVYPRGTAVLATDNTRSLGGVTDVRVAMAYRLTGIAFGVGLHALTGSTETTVDRQFPDDSSYLAFTQQQGTAYTGVGVSFGALANPLHGLVVGAALRFNGRLRAATPDTAASIPMPVEWNVGAYYQPIVGVTFSGSFGHAGWGTAAAALVADSQAPSRSVSNVGFGVEALVWRVGGSLVPLRLGYRWRQLPFPIGGSPLNEHAVTGGLGFDTAGGRATVDLGLELGSRTAGALSESFATAYLGLTIHP